MAITSVLMGEAADWVVSLHANHARELVDVGKFLEALCSRFEDETGAQVAEGDLFALRQRGVPAKDYVWEFWKIAGGLVGWPEHLLVHQFWMGLAQDLKQAGMYRGFPPRLNVWFKAAIELDVGLREFHVQGKGVLGQPKRPVERDQAPRETKASVIPESTDKIRRPLFQCFRCNKIGHRQLSIQCQCHET